MLDGHRQRGLTLIEMVLTIVILAIALVGITQMISAGLGRSADTLLETRAVALAQSYLDEIFGKRFDDLSDPRGIPPCRLVCTDEALFGPEDGVNGRANSGETSRIFYDDVDDYHGLDEGDGQTNPLQDAEGNTRQGYDNFRVRVSVRYLKVDIGGEEAFLGVDSALPDELQQTDMNNTQDAKLITVTVMHRSVPEGWDFSVYKTNF